MKKRFGIGILFLMVAIWVLPITGKAAVDAKTGQTDTVYDGDESELFYELESRMKTAMLTGKKDQNDKYQISLLDLHIPVEQIEKYNPRDVLCLSPYLGQIDDVSMFSTTTETGSYLARVDFANPMNVEETKAYFGLVDAKLKELYDVVNAGENEEQKALLLHDYMVTRYEYDCERLMNGTIPKQSFRSCGMLLNEIGVCQSYAYLYEYVLDHCGMECYFVASEEMKHAWNIVKVDGHYYHVDLTWNDPTNYDRIGYVRHEYFLLSDAAIRGKEEPHRSWDRTDLVCDDTTYDDAYWQDVDAAICIQDGYAYYIDDMAIRKRNLSTGETEKLRTFDVWHVYGSTGYYSKVFSGLFLWKGELYYNTETQIRKISLNGDTDALVYELPAEAKGYMYGSRIKNGQIQYALWPDANGPGEIVTCLETYTYSKTPTFQWSADRKTCKVVYVCNEDSRFNKIYVAQVTPKVTIKATYLKKGTTTYTATYKGEDGRIYTDKRSVQNIPMLKAKTQTIKVSKTASKTVKYKYKTLKKKSASFSVSAKAKGTITYKVTSKPKGAGKYISVDKKGKVKVKKGAKKGTYKITVTAAATKTGEYKKATKVITIVVK